MYKLYDNTLVSCTAERNAWFVIAVEPTNPWEDYNDEFLKKGSKILSGDKVIGEVVKDVKVSLILRGYVKKENIYPESIIENVFTSYLKRINESRSILDYKSFIDNF